MWISWCKQSQQQFFDFWENLYDIFDEYGKNFATFFPLFEEFLWKMFIFDGQEGGYPYIPSPSPHEKYMILTSFLCSQNHSTDIFKENF